MNVRSNAWSWTKGVFVLAVFAMGAIALVAGGLGLAPVATLGGLGAIAAAAAERRILKPGPTAIAGGLLLAWAALSLVWSRFDRPEQFLHTAIGAPLYLGFALLCMSLEGPGRRLARVGVLVCVVLAGAAFAVELVTGGVVTGAHRLEAPDMNTQIWRNLGHGLSGWILLLPAALVVLPRRDRVSLLVALALIAVAFACAIGFGITSNLLGLVAAGLGAALAWRWLRDAVRWIGAAGAVSILAAPAYGLLARAVPEQLRAHIPDSWELRLEAWSYAAGRIAERPLTGWGFDASRTMTDTIEFKGALAPALPLHPHNAGLHLWLEIGLVGAALAAAVVWLIARAIARAPGLVRAQAVAAAAAGAGYLAMAQVSYGVWQEWWIAAVAWAAAAAALAGPAAADARK